ncbi:glucoamylase family protein [Kaistella polysaccharea]|uniref:glucoamylase family protein n=1 Tax=Kaistella polysaccharea TaxID=2878534 RepID=UPI001CF19BE6|nr:glucoamylase family protein [Kaistella polysaccharea]
MNFYKINFFITTAIVLSCGSCSSGERVPDPVKPPVIDPPKVTTYTDPEILNMVQKDVTKYFWDFAEVNSKLARERYHTDNPGADAAVITTGGSGFGMMTLLVAIKNGYVSRPEAVSRLKTSLTFLQNAERFHGAWPHWINGTNGKVIPFGTMDNGGDLVETAFLAQGLICVREYFKNSTDPQEIALSTQADNLWKGVEWNWYAQGQNVLYWHWSPNYDFQMNLPVRGYDETLLTYVLASASPNYTISKSVYQEGWARNGSIKTSASKYGIPLIVNHNGANGTVGPMFFSHYSFLGLDPRGLTDEYVNYGEATTNHAKIMHQYAVENPKNWKGYSTKNWGLTASYTRNGDGTTGYSAHQPNNDLGVISPTAAISSLPYTPEESMSYLRFLYNETNLKYIGVAGPYDAYSIHYDWLTPRYLAIDQGTMSPMIENHKSAFLWNLFMNAPDVKNGLLKLGFHSSKHGF